MGTTLSSARPYICGRRTNNNTPQLKMFLKVLRFQYEIESYKQVSVGKEEGEGGGGGGGGGGGERSPKRFLFSALRALVWSKNKEGAQGPLN